MYVVIMQVVGVDSLQENEYEKRRKSVRCVMERCVSVMWTETTYFSKFVLVVGCGDFPITTWTEVVWKSFPLQSKLRKWLTNVPLYPSFFSQVKSFCQLHLWRWEIEPLSPIHSGGITFTFKSESVPKVSCPDGNVSLCLRSLSEQVKKKKTTSP